MFVIKTSEKKYLKMVGEQESETDNLQEASKFQTKEQAAIFMKPEYEIKAIFIQVR